MPLLVLGHFCSRGSHFQGGKCTKKGGKGVTMGEGVVMACMTHNT